MGGQDHPGSSVFTTTLSIMHRRLLAWEDNDPFQNWLYVFICLILTCMAGLMSGLTLGLLSLDTVELEVLLRSGTTKEQKYARKIMPIVSNGHLLLVTLLLCNALAMEALPLFLDKLADPISAVIVSVTAVLFFGEIIPQSVCTRYGLAIGANLAPFVRLLMWLCSPIAWPTGKLLDLVLGPDHHTLFRRRQLKELVSIHAEEAGMGGALTTDEIKVITGALDLTSKVAFRAMTPLDKVFMLSSADQLDEATLRAVLRSGHSRIPVHRQGDRADVVGLVLVKELLQYRLGASEEVPVAMLRMRSIPRLPATTPMYDMLRLFQTGRSHIAVLTQPAPGELQRLMALDPSVGDAARSRSGRNRGKGPYAGGNTAGKEGAAAGAAGGGGAGGGPPDDGYTGAAAGAAVDGAQAVIARRASTQPIDFDGRSVAGETEAGDMDPEAYVPYSSPYVRPGSGQASSYGASLLDGQGQDNDGPGGVGVGGVGGGGMALDLPAPPSFRPWTVIRSPSPPRSADGEAGDTGDGGAGGGNEGDVGGDGSQRVRQSSVFATKGYQDALLADGAAAAALAPPSPRAAPPPVSPRASLLAGPSPMGSHRLSRMSTDAGLGGAAAAAATDGGDGGVRGTAGGGGGGGASLSAALAAAAAQGGDAGGSGAPPSAAAAAVDGEGGGREDARDDADEPEEGQPIGIITIEDVIEELIRSEILDETDRFVDNDRRIKANQARRAACLPEHLARVLAAAGAGKKAALHRGRSFSGGAGGSTGFGRRSLGYGLSSGTGLASSRDASNHYGEGLRTPLLSGEQ